MSILMTGTRGFIGGHVLQYFRQAHPDVPIVNFVRSRSIVPDEVQCDFSRPITLDWIGDIDYVFHMGAWVNVAKSTVFPDECIRHNILGTYHLLEYCRRFHPHLKMFMYLSTDEVYGPCVDTEESYDELAAHHPTSPYSASKAAAEDLVAAWNASMGVPGLIINCMNVIGIGQREDKFVPTILRCLLGGQPITVHGDPDNPGSRRYMGAKDVARAFEFLLGRGERGQKYHIAGAEEVTNEGMVRKLEKLTGKKADIRYQPFEQCRPGHDRRYSLDTGKMNMLGWYPEEMVDDILTQIVSSEEKNVIVHRCFHGSYAGELYR